MPYILVLDDDEDFANALATVLRADGHEVVVALTGREGFGAMSARPPDLLILDIMFPEDAAEGYGILRRMSALPALARVPVLFVSAVSPPAPLDASGRRSSEEDNARTFFMDKPLDLDALCEKVAAICASPSFEKEMSNRGVNGT